MHMFLISTEIYRYVGNCAKILHTERQDSVFKVKNIKLYANYNNKIHKHIVKIFRRKNRLPKSRLKNLRYFRNFIVKEI